MELPEKNNSRPDDAARLEELRREIDETDQDILARLNRRAGLCREVGRIKSGSAQAVFKPFREKEVLERLTRDNPGVLPEDHLRAIYREILSSSRKLQQPQKAVYLGPEGTFSYFAGVQMLGGSTVFEPCRGLEEVFRAVADKEASLGIVPLENSGQGSVGRNLDLFLKYPVYMQAEIYCRVGHHLVGAGSTLTGVNQVHSHPRALEQCAGWLERHLPEAAVIPARSTAAAARAVVDQPERAVIGHRQLADMFALNLLAADIEDIPDNWTRFVVIGPDLPKGGSRDKTSLLFTLPDRSGALVEILTVLARSHINMTKLESRPIKAERWRYLFFADVECDLSDDEYAGMKQDLAANCHTLRVLGSYPAGEYLDGD